MDVPSASSVGRLIIFVNPNSGSGKGVQTFHRKVEPVLKERRIDFELVVTKGANHARKMVGERDLGTFNAILILSGDGLVFEVINGIFDRRDFWQILHVLPIGIVPSGSGNGLLASVFASRGYPLSNPAFTSKAIELATSSSSRAQPVNLVHAQTRTENFAAFLSIGWGLLADIDIESERWRKALGSGRFAVGALVRCLKLRSYRGRLSFRPHSLPATASFDPFHVFGSNVAEKIRDCSCARPCAEKREGKATRANEDEWLTAHSIEGVAPVDEDVGEGWTTIEDDFVGVYAMCSSHIANDGPMQPRAKLDDDRIYLSYIRRADVPSRVSLLKMLMALEQGQHLQMEFLKWVEVSSFRLQSLSSPNRGRIVLDGELIDTDLIQATVSTHRTAIIADVS